MGINQKPEITDHWKKDGFYLLNFLPNFISIGKFDAIKEIFHVCNNEKPDPLYKI